MNTFIDTPATDASAGQVDASLDTVVEYLDETVIEPKVSKASFLSKLTIAGTLRAVGASVLVLGLANFLLTGVTVQNDLQRFFLLLLQIGLFAGGAFALQRHMNDGRGARLLLGIALLAVPAGTAVLGAMIYGWIPVDGQEWLQTQGWMRSDARYPGFAHWQATIGTDLILAAGAAVLALIPTTWFAISVMARKSASWMVPTFLLSASLLLIPVRDPTLVSLIIVAGALAIFAVLAKKTKHHPELATAEGRFARFALFVPLVIIAARSFAMYPVDIFLTLGASITVFIGVRWCMTLFDKSSRLQLLMYPIAGLVAMFAASNAAVWVEQFNDALVGITITLVMGALLFSLRPLIESKRALFVVEGIAALLAMFMTFAQGFSIIDWTRMDGVLEFSAAVAPAIAVIVYGFAQRRFGLVTLAVLAIAFPFAEVFDDFAGYFLSHGWQSLVAAGLTAVVAASLLEKRRSAKAAAGSLVK